jgi:integrase/recombinase XerD
MNRTVSLTKRVYVEEARDKAGKVTGGMRYCPACFATNGKVRPHVVMVNGNEEHRETGAYYLEWSEGTKRIRKSVGRDAADALARLKTKEAELNAVNNGLELKPENGHRPLPAAVGEYLSDVKLTHKPRSYAAYKTALDYFLQSCRKASVEGIDRRDLLQFSAFLRDKKKQAPRTVYNKFEHVMTFLKAQKVRDLIGKNDWPRYTEEEPEIYEKEEINKLFAACDSEERLWYEFFFQTGMREQEVMHTYWCDVNFAASTIKVTHKPDIGWTPKAYKEREIPVPEKLIKKLKAWKAKSHKGCPLVFPTRGCKPKLNFLDDLKAVAERAGVENAFLHRFRATYATWSLWAGVDLRTVQDRLGHGDMESTMRYLKPSRSVESREKVNAIFG